MLTTFRRLTAERTAKMGTQNYVTVHTPATIANLGPGFDVLGLALGGLSERLTAKLIDGPSTVAGVTGYDAANIPTAREKNLATIAADKFLASKGIAEGITIEIDRSFPVSAGLGSSAAAAVGGAKAAALLSGFDDDWDGILAAAAEAESGQSGFHLDNVVPALVGGIVLAPSQPKAADIFRCPIPADMWLAVVTPKQKLTTHQARQALPTETPMSEWTGELAAASRVVAALHSGDLGRIGHEVNRPSFNERYRGPMIDGFRPAKAAGVKAGALAVSICGAGPSMFAICGSEAQAQTVSDAMVASLGDSAFRFIGQVASAIAPE